MPIKDGNNQECKEKFVCQHQTSTIFATSLVVLFISCTKISNSVIKVSLISYLTYFKSRKYDHHCEYFQMEKNKTKKKLQYLNTADAHVRK